MRIYFLCVFTLNTHDRKCRVSDYQRHAAVMFVTILTDPLSVYREQTLGLSVFYSRLSLQAPGRHMCLS